MAVKAGHKEDLDDLEKRLDEVRRRFDLYFHGSPEQRMPPTASQAQLGGELRRVREEEIRTWNTVDKFRFNQIFARFVSLDRMWARTMKQIEDGTYKRDKFKVQQMKKRDEETAKDPKAQESQKHEKNGVPADTQVGARRPASIDGLDVDVGSFDDAANAPPQERAARAPRPVATPTRPASMGEGGMSDQRLKQLYDVYMQAKKRTGESSSLTMDALKKQIEKQIPAIKAKHNCQSVDFKVVLKDGKAMLKAVPK
jgi:hypothetical protein